MAHKFNIASLLQEFEFANSVSSDLFNRSLSAQPIKLLVDYDSFQDHIFFGNALRSVAKAVTSAPAQLRSQAQQTASNLRSSAQSAVSKLSSLFRR